ncbi:DUF2167 domain-containing protein [Allosphingosinicella flava]|uniref:DUF2167 domain-containing protein n=1 Tax=Allosphingosinicella flava TaxID=2771430 RepID=A0A7T2GL58_9SPHN|nr:DUF2167 domain-containing protein [Sphingosinicella flava]QPQ55890.1 DUF2167 domain-containing protein [Sphingosinicella flava]
MLKSAFAAIAATLLLSAGAIATPSNSGAEESFLRSLHPATGDVAIAGANAVLHLGSNYYFLPADEAKRVLTDVWGNPPDVAEGVLGLVLPAGKTVFDDSWGAVITFEETGYVSDEDAKTSDYDEIIENIRAAEPEINAERARGGYAEQHIVGWAQAPTYDPQTHSLIWAQNIRFGDQADHSLNYDVRLLGRKGVLSMNMLSSMSHLAETREAAGKFGRSAEFTPGNRYADFNPATDAKADFGIAGLVAAGVGVAAAKKLGLLALLLAFGKKFLVLILVGATGIWRWLRNHLKGRAEA